MTKTILALIHNGNLSDNELVVASVGAFEGLLNVATETDARKWITGGKPTKAFQTSKDLKTLETEFKEKGLAVYLHEKENKNYITTNTMFIEPDSGAPICGICRSIILCGETYKLTRLRDFVCRKCEEKGQPIKKPLMLAVFGDTQAIKDVLDASSIAEGEDKIRRLLG